MPAAISTFYRVTWLLLLIVALFTVLFPLLDIVGTARGGLPSDHTAAYRALAGHNFPGIRPTGPTRYIRQLEYGYALHELTFALFFLVIVAIPVRAGQRWAWLACWLILISAIGYTLTFAHYSSKTLAYSLVPTSPSRSCCSPWPPASGSDSPQAAREPAITTNDEE
jgi:hypothetical protein